MMTSAPIKKPSTRASRASTTGLLVLKRDQSERRGGATSTSDMGRSGRGAGHHQTDGLAAGGGVDDASDAALVHHGDAVAQGEDLVEFRRDDQHAHALVALIDHLAVHVLD